jgi:hypothetical protein
MNAQERNLITSVFDRLRRIAGGPRDAEAEALIQSQMRAVPDAAYNLVEAVVVQEQALTQANARINELEGQLAQARAGAQPQQPAGGFGSANPWGRGSVPQTAPQPQYAQPQYAQPGPWGQPSAGGSFLRTAAGAAVGVAGGMLLAEGVSHMFGGGFGGHGGGFGGGASPVSETTNITNNYYGTEPPQSQDVSFDTDVADDSSFFDGGDSDTF